MSVCNLVMPEGRTALDPHAHAWCAADQQKTLRKFMEFMHKKHPELSSTLLDAHMKDLISSLKMEEAAHWQFNGETEGETENQIQYTCPGLNPVVSDEHGVTGYSQRQESNINCPMNG